MDESQLSGLALFESLSKRQRGRLVAHLSEREIELGEHLIDEGQTSYQFFVILEGSAAVIARGMHLTDLGPGDFLGEIGLIRREHRSASVIATSRLKVLVMEAEDFRQMARSMPAVAEQIESVIQERVERDRLFGLRG